MVAIPFLLKAQQDYNKLPYFGSAVAAPTPDEWPERGIVHIDARFPQRLQAFMPA